MSPGLRLAAGTRQGMWAVSICGGQRAEPHAARPRALGAWELGAGRNEGPRGVWIPACSSEQKGEGAKEGRDSGTARSSRAEAEGGENWGVEGKLVPGPGSRQRRLAA